MVNPAGEPFMTVLEFVGESVPDSEPLYVVIYVDVCSIKGLLSPANFSPLPSPSDPLLVITNHAPRETRDWVVRRRARVVLLSQAAIVGVVLRPAVQIALSSSEVTSGFAFLFW